MSEPLIVRVQHARAIVGMGGRGYCVPGMEQFFADHKLDFKDFVRNGIDAEVLLATGDAMAEMVVAKAREEAERG